MNQGVASCTRCACSKYNNSNNLVGIIDKEKKQDTKNNKTRYRQKQYHKNMVVTYVQVLTRIMWFSFIILDLNGNMQRK
jgi:hypothetical protein